MYLVRNVFRCRPGKAKELVAKFTAAKPHLEAGGSTTNVRILTDASATFWTVVVEAQTEDINALLASALDPRAAAEMATALEGYMDCVDSGHREIFKIEVS